MATRRCADLGLPWSLVVVAAYCPQCWKENPLETLRCIACGTPLQESRGNLVLRYIEALRNPEPTRAALAGAIRATFERRSTTLPAVPLALSEGSAARRDKHTQWRAYVRGQFSEGSALITRKTEQKLNRRVGAAIIGLGLAD